jgi:hypothetical protein
VVGECNDFEGIWLFEVGGVMGGFAAIVMIAVVIVAIVGVFVTIVILIVELVVAFGTPRLE